MAVYVALAKGFTKDRLKKDEDTGRDTLPMDKRAGLKKSNGQKPNLDGKHSML